LTTWYLYIFYFPTTLYESNPVIFGEEFVWKKSWWKDRQWCM